MLSALTKLCSCSNPRSNSVSSAGALKSLLPESYEYNICEYEQKESGFLCRFRINVKSKQEALQWLKEFSFLSKTTYRSDKVFPQNTIGNVYKVSKYCHRRTKSDVNKQKNSKGNTNCPARIVLTVKQTSLSRKYKSKDVHLPNFPTIVLLHHTHNHPLNSTDVKQFLIPTDEVKEIYTKVLNEPKNETYEVEPSDTKETVKELENTFKDILSKVKANPEMYNAANMFIESAKNIKTDGALQSALATFGKYDHFSYGACHNDETERPPKQAHLAVETSTLLPNRETTVDGPYIISFCSLRNNSLGEKH